MSNESPLSPWPTERGEAEIDLRLFKVRRDSVVNPRTGRKNRPVVLETPDWCSIVALTANNELILVKQYRFGIEDFTVEVPGGTVDPGEEPLPAAKRELREETGYSSSDWTYLGMDYPNPALQDNRCHHLLAERVVRESDPQPGDGEDIQVLVWSVDRLRSAIGAGDFRHPLGIAALSRVFGIRS